MKKFIVLLLFIFGLSTVAFGQDTLRTNYQEKSKWNQNTHKAKQNQEKRDVFVDEDGDGINDVVQERFEYQIQNRFKNQTGECTEDGKMNQYQYENQHRLNTGIGDSNTENKGDNSTKSQKGKK